MKIANEKYITIKNYLLYGEKAVFTGQVREVAGERQALFFLISGNNPERKVWLSQKDIMV